MNPLVLLREAWAATRASRVPATLVAVVVAATCLAAVTTVGRQAAAEAALAQQLAGPQARTLTVTRTSDAAALTPPALTLLAELNGVAAVVATDLPVDAFNGRLGPGTSPVAVVGIHGTIDRALSVTRGRLPGPAEVVVSSDTLDRLGLSEPVGYLEAADGRQWAIVGSFAAKAPFDDLDAMAVTTPVVTDAEAVAGYSFHQLRVVADAVTHVAAVQAAALAILAPNADEVQVTSALAAANTSQTAAGALAGLGRSFLLLILAAGAFFVAAVVLADVLVRRRDLGRRRTLGITRGALVALVTARTAAPAVLGAVLGSSLGLAWVWRTTGQVLSAFSVAVSVLGVLTAVVAGLAPAIFAARRDPVEVMRTP